MLYIVSTPIGNLKDITYRAVEILKSVHLIAAEDTRHTKILLQNYQIQTSLTSYFEHNKVQKSDYLLNLLKEGKNIALVTDARTPGISDPGYQLIHLAQENSIPMTVIPGPTALIAALSLSGLPTHRFIFEGFLPIKPGARRNKLEQFKNEERVIIFYEAPHRILKVLKDIEEVLGDPVIVCARELTKKFETVYSGTASAVQQLLTADAVKGEFVVIVEGK